MSINSPVVINRVKEMIELPLNEIVELQGKLKRLDKTAYEKFKSQLIENGFTSPIHCWIPPKGKAKILDGHQRVATLKMMREEGVIIPDKFKIVVIEADSEKRARMILLGLTAQYGKMSDESLSDFAIESGIDLDWISTNIELPFNSGADIAPDLDFDPSENDDLDNDDNEKVKCPHCHQVIK